MVSHTEKRELTFEETGGYYTSDAEYEAECRAHMVQVARQRATSDACISAWPHFVLISEGWEEHYFRLKDLWLRVETLWLEICWAGMTTDIDAPLEQQRLVNFLDTIKLRPLLTRTKKTSSETETAEDENGRLWADLPLFKSTIMKLLQEAFDKSNYYQLG